jgi:molybdate transport system ATP-binding protein
VPASMLALEASLARRNLDFAVRLEVGRGETLALAGPSGAGKTTTLRVIAGLVRPGRGRVECDSSVWLDTERGIALAPEQRRCGFVFQEYALFPHLRAWENVAYSLRDVPRRRRREHAERLLGRFGIETLADAPPSQLSGGERQRVALARALAREPAVLLLDEPLAALDARTRADAARQLVSVSAELGAPTVLVTHDFEQASLLAGRVAVIDEGRIVQVGTPADLVASPASAFVADLTGAVVLHGEASPGAGGLTFVELEGGGRVVSTDHASGPVAVTVHPWDVALEPPGTPAAGSAQNRLEATVASVTPLGNRIRVGVLTPQPLTAELTRPALERLAVVPGARTVATWKATGTRLVPR